MILDSPAIGNLWELDDDDYNIEGVCVVDFSGFREYLNKEKPSGSPYFFSVKIWKILEEKLELWRFYCTFADKMYNIKL